MLREAREEYLAKNSKGGIALISDEEKSKYKTMFDAMDEDLDGAITPQEMYRLFHMEPIQPALIEAGITKVSLAEMKEFNAEMNMSCHDLGVRYRDFLVYVHAHKEAEQKAAQKKAKKKKKK
mmetsp:Transcript_17648/g.35613  ORF Transcript_17648/g.35613 Transcript_17648/m.35613 type:complete len:122 (+) Transcript_17648:841-1206(+)